MPLRKFSIVWIDGVVLIDDEDKMTSEIIDYYWIIGERRQMSD
jgi:hypothetical protein